MLERLRSRFAAILKPIVSAIARSGLTPNEITVIGFGVSVVSAYTFFSRQEAIGGVLLLLSGLFDILDGGVARITGRVTKFGGVLDSTLDRYSDAIVIGAIIVARLSDPISGVAALTGSILVSYIRSRGEIEGVKMSGVGIMERAERILVLAVTALFGYVWVGVIILAVLTQVTAVQRLYHLRKALR